MSLRSKMALSFGILSTVVLIAVSLTRTFGIPFTSDLGSFGEARLEAVRSLTLVADLMKDRVTDWLSERSSDARAISETVLMASLTAGMTNQMLKSSTDTETIHGFVKAQPEFQSLSQQLKDMLRSYNRYEAILVAEANSGVVIGSTDDRQVGTSLDKALLRRLSDLDSETFFVIDPIHADQSAHLLTVRRFGSAGSANPCFLVMTVDLERVLKPLLHVGAGLGRSGEVVLVDQDSKLLLKPSQAPAGMSPPGFLRSRIETKPAGLAAAGKEGVVAAKDYRGEEVLAAYRSVELSGKQRIGIVVKRDIAEVFGPLDKRVLAASLISLLGILCASGMGFWIAGKIAGPVDSLTRVAREVAGGNLDARVGARVPGELGILTETFDAMVDRIRRWQEDLESQVKERTAELTAEIAERERVEDALRASEERFELAVKGANDGLWDWFDMGRDLAWFSPRFTEMVGWPDRDRIGSLSHLQSLVHPKDRGKVMSAIRGHVDRDEPLDFECRVRTRSGEYRWFRWRGEALRNSEGVPTRMAGSLQDVTDRKMAEEELERLIAELEAKNAELERFTYTVSHDLSSPLITIKTFVGFVQEDLRQGNPASVNEDLDRISRAAEKMSVLLDQLLELSRIGRIVNVPTEVPLHELAEETVDLLAARIAERQVVVDIALDLPTVFGDRARLMEVMQNLVENAIKFMGDQPNPRIRISAEMKGNEVIVSVSDNGMGVDLAYQEKIFGLFEKLDPACQGTGIGLALAKRIVEVHGGRLWVKSEGPGQGSTFSFSLPTGQEAALVSSGGDHEG